MLHIILKTEYFHL